LDWIYQEHDKIVKNDSSQIKTRVGGGAAVAWESARAARVRDCNTRGRRNRAAATGATRFFGFFYSSSPVATRPSIVVTFP